MTPFYVGFAIGCVVGGSGALVLLAMLTAAARSERMPGAFPIDGEDR